MKSWHKKINGFVTKNRDDLSYLLFVGLPFGIIIILLHTCMDFSHLF
jgi:hypothetical protein